MAPMPCNVVQEYVVPRGVATIRIEAESGGSGERSSSSVTLQVRPGATFRLRFGCLPGRGSTEPPGPGTGRG
jgi:hypothetical protein